MDNNYFNKFQNFISLGYFCGIARDLEKIGLRDFSSPFDWTISNFESVIRLINTNFKDFMKYENLAQNVNNGVYLDEINQIYFYHDFSIKKSLSEKYNQVNEKYIRRIKRFYNEIKKPTLFIRYISNSEKDKNGKSIELDYIEKNYDSIIQCLKKSNQKNEIIFIANNEVISNNIKIFHVTANKKIMYAKCPILKCDELFPLLNNVNHLNKEKNIKRYKKKFLNRFFKRIIKNKITRQIDNKFFKHYIHDKTYPSKK